MVAAKKNESSTAYYQFPAADQRGSVYRLTNENNEITATYEYNAFGEILQNQETGVTNRMGYSANWITLRDSNDEIVLSPSRLYSTKTGQFLQKDFLFPMTLLKQRGMYKNSIFRGGWRSLFGVDNYGLYRAFKENPCKHVDVMGKLQIDPDDPQQKGIIPGSVPITPKYDTLYIFTHMTYAYDGNKTILEAFEEISPMFYSFVKLNQIYNLVGCSDLHCTDDPCPANDSKHFFRVGKIIPSHNGNLPTTDSRIPSDQVPPKYFEDITTANTIVSCGGNFSYCQKRTLRDILSVMIANGRKQIDIILPMNLIYDTINGRWDGIFSDDNANSISLIDRMNNMSQANQIAFLRETFKNLFSPSVQSVNSISQFAVEVYMGVPYAPYTMHFLRGENGVMEAGLNGPAVNPNFVTFSIIPELEKKVK